MHVTIWVSDKCNLHCKYCYEGEGKPDDIMSKEISGSTIAFIKKQMRTRSNGHLSVTFHGGEPLFGFERIKYILNEIKTFFPECRFSMTTNATILTEEIEKFLVCNIDELSVSIDGECLSHDLNRVFSDGKGTYSIVEKNVIKLLSEKKNIRARMTIVPETVNKLSKNIEHLIKLGFHIIEPNLDFTNQAWSKHYIEIYNDELKKTADMLEGYKGIDVPSLYCAACKNINAPCDGGDESFNVAADGSIYPCILTVNREEFVIGHVNGEIDETKVKWIKELDQEENESCTGCQRYQYCKCTRCKLVNYINTGDYNTPLPVMCMSENSAVKIAKYYLKNSRAAQHY